MITREGIRSCSISYAKVLTPDLKDMTMALTAHALPMTPDTQARAVPRWSF